jgi:hypothetical protein
MRFDGNWPVHQPPKIILNLEKLCLFIAVFSRLRYTDDDKL